MLYKQRQNFIVAYVVPVTHTHSRHKFDANKFTLQET